jgi:ribosomal protein L2
MGIRKYKPTTPGRRGSSVADFFFVDTFLTSVRSAGTPRNSSSAAAVKTTASEFSTS